MRKMVSGRIALPASRSIFPKVSSWTTFPRRAIRTSTPAVWFLSTIVWTTDFTWSSLLAEKPASSGVARGNSSALAVRLRPTNNHPERTALLIALMGYALKLEIKALGTDRFLILTVSHSGANDVLRARDTLQHQPNPIGHSAY